MKKNILILGGNGFIGHALCIKLASLGHKLSVISRQKPTCIISGITYYQGSFHNPNILHGILPECDIVFHLATTSTPGDFTRTPSKELEGNVSPLMCLIEELYNYPGIPLIYLSSGGTIYGNPTTLPVTEDQLPSPLSYHAAGKAAAEYFLGVFARQGHTVTILRPSNAYGPGQIYKTGFGIVRTIFERIRRNEPIEIWGNGETMRDYIYINDLIGACVEVINRPTQGTFNVGSGQGYSLNDVCQLAIEITGKQPDIRYIQARKEDVKSIILDSAAFEYQYNWRARTSFRDGLKNTWDWLSDQQP